MYWNQITFSSQTPLPSIQNSKSMCPHITWPRKVHSTLIKQLLSREGESLPNWSFTLAKYPIPLNMKVIEVTRLLNPKLIGAGDPPRCPTNLPYYLSSRQVLSTGKRRRVGSHPIINVDIIQFLFFFWLF